MCKHTCNKALSNADCSVIQSLTDSCQYGPTMSTVLLFNQVKQTHGLSRFEEKLKSGYLLQWHPAKNSVLWKSEQWEKSCRGDQDYYWMYGVGGLQ